MAVLWFVYYLQVCWRPVHKHTASVGRCRPSCGQLGFVTTFETFVGSIRYLSSPHHYLWLFLTDTSGEELHLVWKQQRSGELLTLGHETHQDITTPRHQPTPFSYLFVITLPLLSPLLGKSCRLALLKPILAVPHHGETWRRWTCFSISSRQIASGVKLWHFLFE